MEQYPEEWELVNSFDYPVVTVKDGTMTLSGGDRNIRIILGDGINSGLVSDGYHTFGELYESRNILYIAFCKLLFNYLVIQRSYEEADDIWKSRIQSDGKQEEGWFLLGIAKGPGSQITFHLPDKYWGQLAFIKELPIAPPYDGHTTADVLARIQARIVPFEPLA